MTATDELRRLLDGRGIEYEPIDSVHSPNRRTLWGKAERSKGVFGMCFKYETIEFKKGMRLTISDCSPEQAVEATLGSDLKAENAKLRELVLHMHTCLEHYEPGDTISCKQCPYDNETWGCDYERLMAELGIEVEV